jgi:CBS domain-containing protein
MHQGIRLPREHQAIPLDALRSHHPGGLPVLRRSDPAVSAMLDLEHEPVLTVTEQMDLEAALDAMFRLGMRIFLVVRATAVVGVLSLQEARRAWSGAGERASERARRLQVADVMVPWALAPAVDWAMLRQWSLGDLSEIFAGSETAYLIVLEDDLTSGSRLRGLIARERVERQLSPPFG